METINMLPCDRPQMKRDQVERYLSVYDVNRYTVKLMGFRGYFKQTKGKVTHVYDDAIFIVTPKKYVAFNANTEGIGVLKPGGPYLYKIGIHKSPLEEEVGVKPALYEALKQCGTAIIFRNGIPVTDSPGNRFNIEIHNGGQGYTGSPGSQTIHASQWVEFMRTIKSELKKYSQEIIPYVLVTS